MRKIVRHIRVFLALLVEWLSASFIDFTEGSSPCVFRVCVYYRAPLAIRRRKVWTCVCVCVLCCVVCNFAGLLSRLFRIVVMKAKMFCQFQPRAKQCIVMSAWCVSYIDSCIWFVCLWRNSQYLCFPLSFRCETWKCWLSTNWNPFISSCFPRIISTAPFTFPCFSIPVKVKPSIPFRWKKEWEKSKIGWNLDGMNELSV